jgi:hypothetical protein
MIIKKKKKNLDLIIGLPKIESSKEFSFINAVLYLVD